MTARTDELAEEMQPDKACSFCGDPYWAGWWRGDIDIFCCYRCAVTALPGLLADSLPWVRSDRPEQWLAEFTSAFWRAVWLRLRRMNRK